MEDREGEAGVVSGRVVFFCIDFDSAASDATWSSGARRAAREAAAGAAEFVPPPFSAQHSSNASFIHIANTSSCSALVWSNTRSKESKIAPAGVLLSKPLQLVSLCICRVDRTK